MIFLLIYVKLLIISGFLCHILNKKLSLTFPLSIIFIIFSEYIFGIILNLKAANYFINFFVIFCIFYLICIQKRIKTNRYIDSSFILTSIFYIISIILLKEKSVLSHNELWTWGLTAKNFYISNNLLKFGTNVTNAGYYPGTGLFEYWFSSHFKNFYDGLIFISNALFQYSLTISIGYLIKSKFKFFISLILIFILPSVSNLIFHSLYVEPIIALLFCNISLFLINYKITIKNTIISIILFSGLTLIKSSSVILILILELLILFKNNEKAEERLKLCLNNLIIILFIIFSWDIYLTVNNINSAWDTSNIVNNILVYIKGQADSYKYSIHIIFSKIFLYTEPSVIHLYKLKISELFIIVLPLIYMYSVLKHKKDYKIKELFYLISLVNVLYILGLYLMYLFSFSKWEALCLSAFCRYIQVLNIINLVFCTYVFFTYTNLFKKRNKISIITVVIFLICFISINRFYYTEQYDGIKKYNQISNTQYKDLEKNKNLFNQNDKLLVITPKMVSKNGIREILVYKIRYKYAPLKVNFINETLVTEEKIKDKLACGYTYIYFLDSNEEVIKQYSFLSDKKIEKNKIYKIITKNNQHFEIKTVF